MPKYLLLKHYRGGPEPHRPVPPMDQWAPEDGERHRGTLSSVTCTSSAATSLPPCSTAYADAAHRATGRRRAWTDLAPYQAAPLRQPQSYVGTVVWAGRRASP